MTEPLDPFSKKLLEEAFNKYKEWHNVFGSSIGLAGRYQRAGWLAMTFTDRELELLAGAHLSKLDIGDLKIAGRLVDQVDGSESEVRTL